MDPMHLRLPTYLGRYKINSIYLLTYLHDLPCLIKVYTMLWHSINPWKNDAYKRPIPYEDEAIISLLGKEGSSSSFRQLNI